MSDTDAFAQAGAEEAKTVDLSEVRALAMKQLEYEGDLARLEAQVSEKKKELNKIKQGQLPSALKAAGMRDFKLENGMTVAYKEDMKVSVPKASKAAVIKKMREWDYGASVSKVLTIELGKGIGDNQVGVILAAAAEIGVDVVQTEDIATATVKSALKARRKDGKNDDLSLFGAFPFTEATVK